PFRLSLLDFGEPFASQELLGHIQRGDTDDAGATYQADLCNFRRSIGADCIGSDSQKSSSASKSRCAQKLSSAPTSVSQLTHGSLHLSCSSRTRPCIYAFISFFSSLRNRQSVAWEMSFCGLASLMPTHLTTN